MIGTLKSSPPAKYPHDIAYYNLTASCDSNAHCNHYRGNTFIKVLFYDPDIGNKIEYDDNGLAYSEEYIDELAVLGLSTAEVLIMYRKIWHDFSKTNEIVDDITDEDIEMLTLTLTGNSKFEKLLNNFYGSPSKREELLKYKWFFSYYKQYPVI